MDTPDLIALRPIIAATFEEQREQLKYVSIDRLHHEQAVLNLICWVANGESPWHEKRLRLIVSVLRQLAKERHDARTEANNAARAAAATHAQS